MDFDGWIRLALRGVENGTLRYETVEELGVGDASTADVIACALLSVLDLTTATVVPDLRTGNIVSSRTTHDVITEPRPDLYFLFQVRNQPVVDSRTQPGGFLLNAATKHWGTADAPLVFRVPRPGLVIGGG